VGDYADAMARKAAAGGNTEEERENLRSLSETAVLLAQNLTDMQTELTDGRLRMDELQDANRRIEESGEQASATVGDGFLQMEQEFPELPSLIYDGPFSEHLENVSPKLLEGSAEIDEDLAKQTAAAFLGLPITAMGSGEHCAGTIPCRRFCAGQYCVTVSDRGGEVLEAICSRRPESAALSAEEGVAAARRLLEGWGYKNMAESYHLIQDNVLTVNFAWQRNGVLFYPDLVKVGVALDDGSLMSFDAMGYVAFHCERELPAVQVSSEDARGQVGGELEILAEELAVIPSGGEYETLCYEFKCADQEGRHYIFYVNADTGQQEKILILLEDESGALTL
jgi:germination protein YpeB